MSLAGSSDQLFLDRVSQIFLGSQPKGASVELTLDPVIQKLAYDLIPDGQRGSIVVTNPKTGAIIAMVSKPSYDPNLIATHDPAKEKAGYDQINQVPGHQPEPVRQRTHRRAVGARFRVQARRYRGCIKLRASTTRTVCLPNPDSLPLARFERLPAQLCRRQLLTPATPPISLSPWSSRATRPSPASPWTWARTPSRTRPASSASDRTFGDQLKLQSAVSVFPKNLDQAALAQSAVGPA